MQHTMNKLVHINELVNVGEKSEKPVKKVTPRSIKKFQKPSINTSRQLQVKPFSKIENVYIESSVDPKILKPLQTSNILEKEKVSLQREKENMKSISPDNRLNLNHDSSKDSILCKENVQPSKEKMLSMLMKLKGIYSQPVYEQLHSSDLLSNNLESAQNNSNVSVSLESQKSQSPTKNWSLSTKLWPPDHIPSSNTLQPDKVTTIESNMHNILLSNNQPTLQSSAELQKVDSQASKPSGLFQKLKAMCSKSHPVNSTNPSNPLPSCSNSSTQKTNPIVPFQPILSQNKPPSPKLNNAQTFPSKPTTPPQRMFPPKTDKMNASLNKMEKSPRKRSACYNCGNGDHAFPKCPEPLRKFCRRCGWDNVTARNCPKCTGQSGTTSISKQEARYNI